MMFLLGVFLGGRAARRRLILRGCAAARRRTGLRLSVDRTEHRDRDGSTEQALQ
jgi:hypothetical protein